MRQSRISKEKGFTIVENMLAVAVLAISVLALGQLMSVAVRQNAFRVPGTPLHAGGDGYGTGSGPAAGLSGGVEPGPGSPGSRDRRRLSLGLILGPLAYEHIIPAEDYHGYSFSNFRHATLKAISSGRSVSPPIRQAGFGIAFRLACRASGIATARILCSCSRRSLTVNPSGRSARSA